MRPAWPLLCIACAAPVVPKQVDIELAGCAFVTNDATCELESISTQTSTQIVGWVPMDARELSLDGRAIDAELARVEGGTRFVIDVPRGTRALEVRGGDRRARARFAAARTSEGLDAIRALRNAGRLEEAERAIDDARTAAGVPRDAPGAPRDALRAPRLDGLAARLAFSRGNPTETVALYRRSIPALYAAGRTSEAASDSFALFYVLHEQLHRFDEARGLLERTEARLAAYAEGRAWLAYYRAVAALRIGELGDARDRIDEALARAERLNLRAVRSTALGMRAWIDGLLGHHATASADADRATEDALGDAPCERAAALTNAGWQRLLAAEAGLHAVGEARERFDRALAVAEAECAGTPLLPQILVNQAEAALLDGDLEGAAAAIDRARSLGFENDAMVVVNRLDVEGRALLARGEAEEALRVYDELAARIQLAGASLPQGELGRGLALVALDRLPDAVTALRRADGAIDEQMIRVPLAVGRETFSLGRMRAAELLVRTLVRLGRAGEALDTARHARARLLWSLPRFAALDVSLDTGAREARDRALRDYWQEREEQASRADLAWRLPADELAAARLEMGAPSDPAIVLAVPGIAPRAHARSVETDELLVLFFPSGETMFVFAKSQSSGVRVVSMPIDAPERWWGPFEDDLDAARVTTIIAPEVGPASRAHWLPLAGEPLAVRASTRYAVDLEPSAPASSAERDLFVVDPHSDLPNARREGEWLREHHAGEWAFGGEASERLVLEHLPRTRHFHYAGHAVAEARWWNSGLSLARDGSLSIADVLAAPSVPRDVVLAGCDTATTHVGGAVAGVGIAQAFVLRGAAWVLASTEPVDDAGAARLVRAFYESPEVHPEARYRDAARAHPPAGAAFRLLVP
jgi:tetratricopeptide (TPR) repeat protein